MRGSVKKVGQSWMFVVDLPRGLDGRRRQQKRRGFNTRKAAETALHEMLGRLKSGIFVEPSRLTVADFMSDHWLPVVVDQVRESTFDSYSRNNRLHVQPSLGAVKLQALTTPLLNALYRSLTEKGLSPKTVRHIHTLLRKALSDAIRWGLLDRNPADAADPPKLVRKEMKTWTAQEIRAFLSSIDSDPLIAVFTLLCTTGMRRGEVLGLRWADVDLKHGRLRVQKTLTSVNYRLVYGEPKTNRGRRLIPIDAHSLAVLLRHHSKQSESRLLVGSGWQNSLDLVFTRPDGSPIHPDTVSDTFDRRVRAAGLKKIRLHDLRHSWATLALEKNVPVKIVSEMLGHSSPAFTLDVYSHVTPIMMEDLARLVGEQIFQDSEES